MRKIVFLDIDGVLNCETAYKSGECKYRDDLPIANHLTKKKYYQTFYSKSKELLNKLIEETNAEIVVSSTWRLSGIEWMRAVWESEKMSGNIIGVTPTFMPVTVGKHSYSLPRGTEIDYYLKNTLKFQHINWSKEYQQDYIEKSGIDNYIILDDDADMLYGQKNHFVHVLPSPRNKDGFNHAHYEDALNKLSKTVIDLNY